LIEHLQQSPKSQISRRDINAFVPPLLGERQVHVQEQRFSEASSAKKHYHTLVLMQAINEGG
jgi:hypothetical protein